MVDHLDKRGPDRKENKNNLPISIIANMVQSNGKDFMKTKGAGNFARKKSQSKCIEMYEAQPT